MISFTCRNFTFVDIFCIFNVQKRCDWSQFMHTVNLKIKIRRFNNGYIWNVKRHIMKQIQNACSEWTIPLLTWPLCFLCSTTKCWPPPHLMVVYKFTSWAQGSPFLFHPWKFKILRPGSQFQLLRHQCCLHRLAYLHKYLEILTVQNHPNFNNFKGGFYLS